MSNDNEEITKLKQEIQELKAEMELQWQSHLQKEKEIEALQEKQHQAIIKKQEEGFFKQKMMGLGGFSGLIIAGISAFIVVAKKLKEAKQEIKELLKR